MICNTVIVMRLNANRQKNVKYMKKKTVYDVKVSCDDMLLHHCPTLREF